MNDKPIGIFDSGVGGLTVAKEIYTLLPHESTVYVGDTARVPYGNRSAQIIIQYSHEIAQFLINRQVKAIVVACSTVSAVALNILKKTYNIPIIGVIYPTAQTTAMLKSRVLGIIGTQQTIKSQAYAQAVQSLNPKVEILSQACPLLVPLIEEGMTQTSILYPVIKAYLEPMKLRPIDTLLLGCTHYPVITAQLQQFFGSRVSIVSSGPSTAKYLKQTLSKLHLLNPQLKVGHHQYITTDSPDKFMKLAHTFLGHAITNHTTQIEL